MFPFLVEANEKSEWTWMFYFKYVFNIIFGSYIFGGIASVLYCFYEHGKFDYEHAYVPYSFR